MSFLAFLSLLFVTITCRYAHDSWTTQKKIVDTLYVKTCGIRPIPPSLSRLFGPTILSVCLSQPTPRLAFSTPMYYLSLIYVPITLLRFSLVLS